MCSMAEASKQSTNSPTDADTMDASVAVEDFINTGRTGRRNAMADISDAHIGTVSTAGVDFSFDQLSVSDPKSGGLDQDKASPASEADKTQAAQS